MAVEILSNTDKSAIAAPSSDVSSAVAPPDLPVALADVAADFSPETVVLSQVDAIVVDDAPFTVANTHTITVAEHPVTLVADEELDPSNSELPIAETEKENKDEVAPISLTFELADPDANVEASAQVVEHAEETIPIVENDTSEACIIEEAPAEPAVEEDVVPVLVDPAAEQDMEIHDRDLPTALYEQAEPIVIAELPTSIANNVDDVPNPLDPEPDAVAEASAPSNAIEVNNQATHNLIGPQDPNLVDAPPNEKDATISEPVAELAEVHETDNVEPADVTAAPNCEVQSGDDTALVLETVEPSSVTETSVLKEPAEDVLVSGSKAVELLESVPTIVEEVPAPTPVDQGGHEPEDPKPIVDAPAIDADDPSVAEPAKAHETDLDEPMIITAVLTTEMESVEDVAPVANAVEHSSATETITLQDAAEDVLDGGEETVEPSECEPTTAEELSVPALEAPGEDNAAVHAHPIEAAALTMIDDEPAGGQLLQSVEPNEKPVDVAHDASPAEASETEEITNPMTIEVSATTDLEADATPSAIIEDASEAVPVESPPAEDVKIAEVENAITHESQDVPEPPIVEKVQHTSNAVPEAADGLPASEQEEQPATILDSDLPPEEAKQAEAGTVVEVEKAYETGMEGLSSSGQTATNGPPAEEGDRLSEEAPAPTGKAVVVQQVPVVTDANESSQEAAVVVEIVTAAEPTGPEETVREDLKDTITTETVPLLSANGDTPFSEEAEPVDVQEHSHTDAKTADELLVHEDTETAEIEEPVDVDDTCTISVDGQVKELIQTECVRVIEEPAIELSSTKLFKESVETGAAEEAVMNAVPSVEDVPVLESSTEAALKQDTDIKTKVVDEPQPTVEEYATEDKPVVEESPEHPVHDAPVVHEEESLPVTSDSILCTPREPLSNDQSTTEEILPVAAPLEKELSAPSIETTEELESTPETTIPVSEVELVETGKTVQ